MSTVARLGGRELDILRHLGEVRSYGTDPQRPRSSYWCREQERPLDNDVLLRLVQKGYVEAFPAGPNTLRWNLTPAGVAVVAENVARR